MKTTKNIFLTTLEETKNRLDVNYYVCDSSDGSYAYTTSISVAEAGIKYMLSQHHLDEIIVIGTPDLIKEDMTEKTELDKIPFAETSSLEEMSEFGFLTYRISEYMKQLDFEMLDIAELVPPERQAALKKEVDAFRKEQLKDVGYRELFMALATDREVSKLFAKNILSHCTPDEAKSIKYYIYSQMDSHYKMHMLEMNNNTKIRFLPISFDGTISIESINSVVRKTLEDQNSAINLYMDIKGIGAIDGSTLISTFMLMNNRIGYGCNIAGLIHSAKDHFAFAGTVSNIIKSYNINNLISGIETFLKYGKVDILKEYRESLNISDPDADRLFYAMDCIDEGITLCNVDLIAKGIKIIRKTISEPKTNPEDRNIYMEIIINAIKEDYGPLLKGDELSIVELLKWSHRKGLYQQTLTIIESKVPEDMVKRGIYYYARNEQDVANLCKEINVLYWNDSAKSRWAYNEVEHFFVKMYGRSAIDYRQKPDMVARDYAKLRVTALHKKVEGVLPAYSELGNDDLLFELLLAYYRIGNLRNQVNHAIVDEADLNSDELAPRKDNRKLLDDELGKFINLYNSACKRTNKKHEPVILPSERLRNYVRRHELKLVEAAPDLTVNNNFTCNYNGKEIQISISMLKPEQDFDQE